MSFESIETVDIKIEIELELVKEEPKCEESEETEAVFIKGEPECVTEEVIKEESKCAMDIKIEGSSNNFEEERPNGIGENVSDLTVTPAICEPSQQTDKCQACQESLANVTHLFAHICPEKYTQNIDMVEIHCCDICQRKFKHKHALDIHRKRHFNRKYACETCNIRFGNEINLKAHVTDYHSGKEDKESCFKCEICPKQFWSKSHLTKHEARHKDCSSLNVENGAPFRTNVPTSRTGDPAQQDSQSHKCPDCLKTFTHIALQSHSCAPVKPHSCDVCSMKFKHKHTLNVHRSKHFDRIFACETCKIRFDNEIFLNAHFADFHTSAESKPSYFQCEKCHKQFRSKNHLTQHEISHEVSTYKS